MPPAPPAAATLFGAALPLAQRFAALLAGAGVERGLLGPREAERLWDRHLLNCAAVAELVPARCSVVDLGSGAGLPGLVLAAVRPQASFVLLEPMARRVAFLEECIAALGLANAATCRKRAEDAAGEITGDVVTARAVAPPGRPAALAAGLARPGGRVLAMKGTRAAAELEEALPALRKAGLRDAAIVRVGVGVVSPAPYVVRMTAAGRRG